MITRRRRAKPSVLIVTASGSGTLRLDGMIAIGDIVRGLGDDYMITRRLADNTYEARPPTRWVRFRCWLYVMRRRLPVPPPDYFIVAVILALALLGTYAVLILIVLVRWCVNWALS